MRLLMAVCVVAILTVTAAHGQSYVYSTLTLDPIPSWTYVGETVIFTGMLTGGGYLLPGKTIWICEDVPLFFDNCLASGATDHAGRFSIEWTAEADIAETDIDIYAKFDGDDQYADAQSPEQAMNVYKYGGSIVLDPIPASAPFDQVVRFTGTLTLDGHSPEGAIVYIKDEDTLLPGDLLTASDLLTAAYVNSEGRFTTSWLVEAVDIDDTVDIYAVFEGNALYDRLASPVQEMRPYADPLVPDPSPIDSDGYMELYRSLNFEQAPRVLIIPSPDSYDEVRTHIFPVQEGIMLLTTMLEREYEDGDWHVEFEVMGLGKSFAAQEPDIVVKLLTRDEDSGCGSDYAGLARITDTKPIPTVVCSIEGRTDEAVGSTAMHEFMHAIGVGHAFNIRGDRMCSSEDGVDTCPDLNNRSSKPSHINLAAIVALYGTDGFQNPNNIITHGERLTLADYRSGDFTTPLPDQEPLTTEYLGGYDGFVYTDYTSYLPGESVLIDGFYWTAYDGPSSIMVVDPEGYVVDDIRMDVVDDFFAVQTAGYYVPGVYTVWVFDGQENFVANTAFYVEYPWVPVSAYEGYIYSELAEYGLGEAATVEGYYWDPYYASSSIEILGPDGILADYASLDAVISDFSVTTGGFYEPGAYTVLLYDHLYDLVSSSTFRVVGPADASMYSASIYTDYIEYYPGEVVFIDGFYWGEYEGPSRIDVEDPYGYVVDELHVDVVDDFFVAETVGHYLPGMYTVWLYDDMGGLASGTAFYIADIDEQ